MEVGFSQTKKQIYHLMTIRIGIIFYYSTIVAQQVIKSNSFVIETKFGTQLDMPSIAT